MRIRLLGIMLLATCFSLISEETNYREMHHLYMRAIWESDRSLMINTSNQLELLNDDVYENYQFFHLSVLVFSSLGEYDRVDVLLDKVENVFSDRFEYWFVKGMALEKRGQNGDLSFQIAYEKFLQKYEDENLVRIFFVYLSLLIGKDIDNALLLLDGKEKEIVNKYLILGREELLKVSPFDLFYYKPVVFLEKETAKDWWK